MPYVISNKKILNLLKEQTISSRKFILVKRNFYDISYKSFQEQLTRKIVQYEQKIK